MNWYLIKDALQSFRGFFSFEYNDKPMSKKIYYANRHWAGLIHNYYLLIRHFGNTLQAQSKAKNEKVIVISNHANTLEAYALYYYFYQQNLGMIRGLVFPSVFRLPFFRELARSGQALPISISAGTKALKEDHILVFPEGMEFAKRYCDAKNPVRFHTGFLRIAKQYLEETQAKEVTILSVGHHGFDSALPLWVLQNEWLNKNIIKPYLGFPYLTIPKSPIMLRTKAAYYWGKPRTLKLSDLKTEAQIKKLKTSFEKEINQLCTKAQKKWETL